MFHNLLFIPFNTQTIQDSIPIGCVACRPYPIIFHVCGGGGGEYPPLLMYLISGADYPPLDIPTPLRSHAHGVSTHPLDIPTLLWHTYPLDETWYQRYPPQEKNMGPEIPPSCEQTDISENITFPKLCWWEGNKPSVNMDVMEVH